LASAFVQDEMTLLPDQLRLIAGARLEYNNFTGFEPQPNLRMVGTPTPNQSVSSALSYAVRTPSRATADDADPAEASEAAAIAGSSPRHQLSLRSAFTLNSRNQWDLWLRYVDALGTVNQQGHSIAAYTALDMRYGWRATPALELSIVGQNLLQHRHAEFVPDLLPSQTLLVERSFYIKAKYQF
jgi:outer membrane receptor for ferrienterochelin and colicin